MGFAQRNILLGTLIVLACIVVSFKILNLQVGAPFVTIDDQTMYEGGFLVWFGAAPPQRMYLESWLGGLISIATYVAEMVGSGQVQALGANLIADAYRSFYVRPDPFVHNYRIFILIIDLFTATIVYAFARVALQKLKDVRLLALMAAVFYLISFNTLWCDVVARPDTLAALFASVGLFFYYSSEFGKRQKLFIGSAIAFGLAAGMKLHTALFTIFIIADLVRLYGIRAAAGNSALLGLVSFAAFCVSAGMPLFDPLLYVKLRYLNAVDDASPWIHWGEQFQVVLFGSGWVVVPLLIYGCIQARRSGEWRSNKNVSSVFFLAICWLLLFVTIRQLRSYWMLPALPLLYAGAIYGLQSIRQYWMKSAVLLIALGVMGFQCFNQMQALRSTQYAELRNWITRNISPDQSFYVLGSVDLGLPKNSRSIANQRVGIERKFNSAIVGGESFTSRHARMWEERARLTLLDMLQFRSDVGYSYYGYFENPLSDYKGLIDLDQMSYIIVQEHFSFDQATDLRATLTTNYEEVASVWGPGGHSNGLRYQILKRK
jgi:hypothetical protein